MLGQRAGPERACSQPQEGGGGGDQRGEPAALGLQVDQRRAERTGGCADGHALQRPRGEQEPDAVRRQEHRARARGHREGGEDYAPAAQVVRHRPEDQQRQEKNEGVDGEDGGQRGRREPQFGPVDAVQRRRCAGREEQQAEYPGHQPERRSRRRRAPGMLPRSLHPRPAVLFGVAARAFAAGHGVGQGHRRFLLEVTGFRHHRRRDGLVDEGSRHKAGVVERQMVTREARRPRCSGSDLPVYMAGVESAISLSPSLSGGRAGRWPRSPGPPVAAPRACGALSEALARGAERLVLERAGVLCGHGRAPSREDGLRPRECLVGDASACRSVWSMNQS